MPTGAIPVATLELQTAVVKAGHAAGMPVVGHALSDPATVIKHRKVIAEELSQARQSNGTVTMSDLKSSLYGATIEGGWPKPIVLGHNPTEEVRLA